MARQAAIVSIEIVYDEGTDPVGGTSLQDPMSIGLAVIDNIYINGEIITDKHDSN